MHIDRIDNVFGETGHLLMTDKRNYSLTLDEESEVNIDTVLRSLKYCTLYSQLLNVPLKLRTVRQRMHTLQ